MDHSMMMTEDMKHRRDRKGNLFIVFKRGEECSLQSAERHDVTMTVFSALRKAGCAARKKHHGVVLSVRQRLRQAFRSFADPRCDGIRALADDENMRDAHRCGNLG